MLREILTTGYIEKKINLEGKKKLLSPEKSNNIKKNKSPSFNSLNFSSKKKDKIDNKKNIPIMKNTIDTIMNRPDFLIGQNNESTMPTTSINKPFLYSNEITKNLMTPSIVENLNLNINEINSDKEEVSMEIKNKNSNSASDLKIKNDNIIQKRTKLKDNNNSNEINKANNIILNDKNIKEKEKEIVFPYTENKNSINAEIQNNKSITNSKNKLKSDNNKSFEINMSLLSDEGIDKLKLLEEYIAQIKENSTNINEEKFQQLKNKKNKLECSVNILSTNIRLNRKKYKDNQKMKNNLELEKERVNYDSNKANKDAFSLLKDLPNYRVEIEIMKNQITQAREETKGIINYTNDIERQTMEIQDEQKKINVKISNVIKEKDKISNEIYSLNKKCNTLRSKIDKVEKSANEFLYSVEQLAKLSKQNKI